MRSFLKNSVTVLNQTNKFAKTTSIIREDSIDFMYKRCSCCGGYFGFSFSPKKNMFKWGCTNEGREGGFCKHKNLEKFCDLSDQCPINNKETVKKRWEMISNLIFIIRAFTECFGTVQLHFNMVNTIEMFYVSEYLLQSRDPRFLKTILKYDKMLVILLSSVTPYNYTIHKVRHFVLKLTNFLNNKKIPIYKLTRYFEKSILNVDAAIVVKIDKNVSLFAATDKLYNKKIKEELDSVISNFRKKLKD
jgi:hypothetical protein